MSLSPTVEQKEAIDVIEGWMDRPEKQVLTFGGYAGTGKTTVLKMLGLGGRNAVITSLTGKAVSVLKGKGLPAQTLHSYLYRAFKDDDGNLHFTMRDDLWADLIVVDEASMLPLDVLTDLEHVGVPILMVGDHGQLEPVGTDPGLMKNPDVKLETIHRQAEASPIIRFAHFLREGGSPYDWRDLNEDGLWVGSLDKYPFDPAKQQALVGKHKARRVINEVSREHFGFTEPLCVGDRLVCLKNDTEYGVFNGLQGTVLNVKGRQGSVSEATVMTDTGQLTLPIDRPSLGSETVMMKAKGRTFWDYGYALTCHKSQGSEWESVMVFDDPSVSFFCDMNRWRYTAATRARTNLTFILE